MCTSALQGVFIVILVVAIVMTLAAMFTPGWRNFSLDTSNLTAKAIEEKKLPSFGILSKICSDDTTGTVGGGTAGTGKSVCDQWWENQPTWQKAVIAGMVIGLLGEILCAIWSCVMCAVCCCKSCLAPPLPIFAGISTLALLIAVAVFGAKNKDVIQTMGVPNSPGAMKATGDTGYSFWLAVIALLAMGIDTIVAMLLAKVSKVSPI